MNDKIKHLIDTAEKSDAIAINKWRIENREQLRKERKQKLKELMEKDKKQMEKDKKQKAINALIILIGMLALIIAMHKSIHFFLGVIILLLLVFAYCGIYLMLSRNTTNKVKIEK
jgi:Flp pilus assembly protein TadB